MNESAEAGAPLRVLLVDDQQLVRSGFAMMLSVEDDITVVGEAANGQVALTQARALRPDVILMDVQMPVMDGIEATGLIVAEDLGKVLILTTFDRDDYLFDALAAGASGFLLKNAGPEQLVEAIRAVGHGHALLAPEVTCRVIAAMTGVAADPSTRQHSTNRGVMHAPGPGADPSTRQHSTNRGVVYAPGAGGIPNPRAEQAARDLAHLTEREREVLGLVARGLSNAEIARTLFVGEATVKTHVSNCLAKLHLRDRVQAVIFAYEHGLAGP